jgi:hypothetical protein
MEAAFRGVKKPGKLEPMNLDAGSLRESLTHICRQFRVERLIWLAPPRMGVSIPNAVIWIFS